jgi:NAD(P)-dependent dehydrogenase (short-subunit alcohol dehydrogenase family)
MSAERLSRVVLLTGGTSGIGAAAARALVERNLTVVIVGRDRTRCESTIALIKQATPTGAVDYLLADLSSQAGVRYIAEEFRRRYGSLHVLINNVGGLFMNRRQSVDGIELTLALNHLGPFLLTNLLLPLMSASAPARIINVSSSAHQLSTGLRRDDLQWRRGLYRGFPAYRQSKLANLFFTYQLAHRLEGTGVTVNASDPGLVSTNIGMDNAWYWKLLKPVMDKVFRLRYVDPDRGARTLVYLATASEVERITGSYFVDEAAVLSSAASRDEDTGRWLWRASEELTELLAGQDSPQ